MNRNATPYALCAPATLDALDDTLEQARELAAHLGATEGMRTLRALLDRAASHLEMLQSDPANLPPACP